MASIDLVMLDCDGVLIDSEIIAAEVESEKLTAWGYPIEPAVYAERFAGMSEEDIVERIAEETGRRLPDDHPETVRAAIFERVASGVEAIEGAAAMIAALPAPVCVCSNSGTDYLRAALERVGLWETLGEHVYSGRELGAPKPDPRVFLHAAEALGADPRRSVVLEDSVYGVEAALAAGARAIGFTGGAHSWRGHADALSEAGATTVVARHADVAPTVAALAQWDDRAA